jgi:hypothetical protein
VSAARILEANGSLRRTTGLNQGKDYLYLVSANFPRQEGRARVFLEERQAV